MANDQPPVTTDGNPFSLLAYIVFKVRRGIEDQENANRPPRWVRIARGAKFKDEIIGKGVGFAVQGLADAVTFLAELTLDLEELLFQTDAAKAMAEVVLRMVSAVGDDEFKDGIAAIFDEDGNNPTLAELNSVLDSIQGATEDIERVLDYIPEPEDVRSLGHELYLLMCLIQHPFPRKAADNTIDTGSTDLKHSEKQVDQVEVGKIWPLIWAYNVRTAPADRKKVTARGLGSNEDNTAELRFFGLRRLWTADLAQLPHKVESIWQGNDDSVEIYEYDFAPNVADDANTKTFNISKEDFKDLILLLDRHGYKTPALDANTLNWDNIRINLMKFQYLNDLAVTGELDNATINRLLNLDFDRKNLRRAVPYRAAQWPWPTPSVTPQNPDPPDPPPASPLDGYLQLINPGADEFDDEGINVQSNAGSPYDYYVVPTLPGGISPKSVNNWPKKQGWLSEANNARGFVALRSRARNPQAGDTPPSGASADGRFVGGLYSEGESAHGEYFWAGRHTEPWKPGRTGVPVDGLFGGGKPLPESPNGPVISRMYQWVKFPDWLIGPNAAPVPGMKLYMTAAALQRSLFSDRNGNGYSDQGRIRLELHTSFDANVTPMALPVAVAAAASSTTDWFPSHGLTAAVLDIALVDRQRLWVLRRTDELEIPPGTVAACLVVEGRYQSAYDIDAYFEDFQIQFRWRLP